MQGIEGEREQAKYWIQQCSVFCKSRILALSTHAMSSLRVPAQSLLTAVSSNVKYICDRIYENGPNSAKRTFAVRPFVAGHVHLGRLVDFFTNTEYDVLPIAWTSFTARRMVTNAT